MTDEDLESRLREMLATRALDVSATDVDPRAAALNGLVPRARRRFSEHTAEQAPPKPPRGRVRVLVAAAVLVVAGSASFVAVRENRAQPLVAGNEPGEPQPEVSPTFPTPTLDLGEQLVPSTEQAEGVADPAWPLPRLVIDPAKVGLEAVSKGQFDNSVNPDDTREREHIQSFREASESLVGPMIFVVSDQDGSDFLSSGQTQGLESFVVDGYEFYPMASGGNPQMLIGSGPGGSSVVVVGVGMTRARVVEFAERMRAPLPGTVAWRVPDPGPVLVPVFAGFRRLTDSPTAGLSQFASWEIGGDQALLVVAGGGEAEFEYQLYDAAKRAWGSVSISFEVVEGRSAVLISSSLVQAAIWRENDQATALLIGGPTDGAGSSTAFSIRDLLGTITEVSEAEWLALGRSIEANDGEPPAVTAPPGS